MLITPEGGKDPGVSTVWFWSICFMFGTRILPYHCCVNIFFRQVFVTEFLQNLFSLHRKVLIRHQESQHFFPQVSTSLSPGEIFQDRSRYGLQQGNRGEERLGLHPFSWDVTSMGSLIAEQPPNSSGTCRVDHKSPPQLGENEKQWVAEANGQMCGGAAEEQDRFMASSLMR